MEDAREDAVETVKTFLASNGSATSQRSTIVFDNLVVQGRGAGVQAAPTVWRTVKSWANLLDPRTYGQHAPSRTLLHGISGSVDSGEMLLVIGRPGSGCTTFLKALSNMHDEYKSVSGHLTYGSRPTRGSDPDPVRLTFCEEEDDHLPTLTVAQTLRFAIRARWDATASEATVNTAVETLASCVGLSHVLGTKVGNSAIRGVSGGERRRVSLAEAIATCPDLLCIDNPTNGLDSSTALSFTRVIREFTRQSRCATVMSVYQASDAMVPLFDKVVVINGGRQIFYGKATEAKSYFEGLGFVCSERTTITDFLNSMSSAPEQRHAREGWESRVPRTAAEFEDMFRRSKHWNAVQADISAEQARESVPGSRRDVYSLPFYRQVLACSARQFRVLAHDTRTWLTEAITIIVQSLVLGTLFYNQPRTTQAFFILASSLFFSVLVPALQSMSEFNNSFAERPLVMRQKRYRFYRPSAYALGLVLTDVAWKTIAVSYNIPQYFLTGFQRSAGKFFTWFCIVYLLHLALSMFFRAIAVGSRNMGRAVLPVGIMFNVFVLYTGLYVPQPQMQVWLSWIRYCNPLYYAYESVMVNEFGNLDYSCSPNDTAPSGTGYDNIANQICAVKGAVTGEPSVSGAEFLKEQYGFEVSNLWRNVVINIAFFICFALCTAVGMERYKLPAGRLATIFYKRVPRSAEPIARGEISFDLEKGATDSDKPPFTSGYTTPVDTVTKHDGRVLSWSNISLEVKVDGELKRLLNNLNGFVEPGQLTALMGASGAGKTTLLNALAGRLDFGILSGQIYLDGGPLPKSFRRRIGYVQQQDVHLPTQTVREALQMTARLRRPASVPEAEKDAHVESVIRILELGDIADALIGVPGAGLNLEQRKRVTIGVELSASPDILLLDEPTSGLDGQSALTIGRLLRKLAESGQTVVCTIHQPAAELIELFHHLVLLVPGGRLAYDGPLGEKCSTALDYFANSTDPAHSQSCHEDENPAEYLIEVVRSGGVDYYPDLWQSSSSSAARNAAREGLTAKKHESLEDISSAVGTHAVPFSKQFKETMRRTWLYYWRDPDYFVSKLFMNVGNALLNGLTYINSGANENGAYNRVFSIFMSFIVGPPLGLQLQPRFVALRDIFTQREQASQTYSWLCFVLPAILVEIPYALVTSLAYWLLWYFPVGYFTQPGRAGYSLLAYQLFSIFAHSLAQLCASLMPSLNATFMANGFFFMFVNTFAGTLSPEPVTPAGWRWYYKVSPLYYLSEGITANALYGVDIACDPAEMFTFTLPPDGGNGTTCQAFAAEFLQTATGYLLDPDATEECQYCRYEDGQSYYAQWGYDFANRYRNIGIFIGFIAFNYTAVITLTYLLKVKKWHRD